MAVDEKILNRIKALLAKAESTNHEAEADAFFAKAQDLMMKFAVDEAMLAAAGGKGQREQIVTRTIDLRSWIQEIQGSFLGGLAPILNCRTYRSGNARTNRRRYYIVGFESDAIFCELLFSSIAAQAWRAALHEGHAGRTKVKCEDCNGTGEDQFYLDGTPCSHCKGKGTRQQSKGTQAKSFLEGYFGRVLIRARERYVKMEAEAGPGTALALRDRGDQVSDWLKNNVSLTAARASRRRAFDPESYSAGHRAGERADISGGRGHVKGGGRKELS